MGLGDMLGKAVGSLGGTDEIVNKLRENGLDLSSLAEMDPDALRGKLEAYGIDPAMLERFGLSVEDVQAKIRERLA